MDSTICGLKTDLTENQKVGVEWILKRESKSAQYTRGGIMGDEMGLGKTLSILSGVASYSFKPNSTAKTIVICAGQICGVWQSQIEEHFNSSAFPNGYNILQTSVSHVESNFFRIIDCDIIIATYDCVRISIESFILTFNNYIRQKIFNLTNTCSDDNNSMLEESEESRKKIDSFLTDLGLTRNDVKNCACHSSPTLNLKSAHLDELKNTIHGHQSIFLHKFKRVILDEAHKIRNHRTQYFSSIMQLRSDIKWFVSGTPFNNTSDDLWSAFRFLGIYDAKYCTEDIRSWHTFSKLYTEKNEHAVSFYAPIMKEILLRRINNSIPIDQQCIIVKFNTPQEQAIYSAIQSQFMDKFSTNKEFILRILIRMLQSCISPHILLMANKENRSKRQRTNNASDSSSLYTIAPDLLPVEPLIREFISLGINSSKMDHVIKYIDKIPPNQKFVIFTQYTDVVDLAAACIEEALPGIKMFKLDGRILKISDRQAIIQLFFDFVGKCGFICTVDSVSEGVDLTAASWVLFTDIPFNPSKIRQAYYRCVRPGQKSDTVHVVHFLIKDSIEDRVVKSYIDKSSQSSIFIDDFTSSSSSSKKNETEKEVVPLKNIFNILSQHNARKWIPRRNQSPPSGIKPFDISTLESIHKTTYLSVK